MYTADGFPGESFPTLLHACRALTDGEFPTRVVCVTRANSGLCVEWYVYTGRDDYRGVVLQQVTKLGGPIWRGES
jgi:hypothetical protein